MTLDCKALNLEWMQPYNAAHSLHVLKSGNLNTSSGSKCSTLGFLELRWNQQAFAARCPLMVASLAAAEEIIQDTAIAAFLSKSGGIKLIKHQNNLVFLMSYTCLVSLKKNQFLKFRYLKKKIKHQVGSCPLTYGHSFLAWTHMRFQLDRTHFHHLIMRHMLIGRISSGRGGGGCNSKRTIYRPKWPVRRLQDSASHVWTWFRAGCQQRRRIKISCFSSLLFEFYIIRKEFS